MCCKKSGSSTRALQASVAHDLRNPIAIMTGYVEYLQENSRGGTLTEEKLEKALSRQNAMLQTKSQPDFPLRKTEGIGD